MNINELKFEEAFAALEETVRQLEEGDLPLESALELFAQGVALAQRCDELLDQAELRVSQLVPSADSEGYELQPFQTSC